MKKYSSIILLLISFAGLIFISATNSRNIGLSGNEDLTISILCEPMRNCVVTIVNSSDDLDYTNIEYELSYDSNGQHITETLVIEDTINAQSQADFSIGLLFGQAPEISARILSARPVFYDL